MDQTLCGSEAGITQTTLAPPENGRNEFVRRGFGRQDALRLWAGVSLGTVRADSPDLTPRQIALLLIVYLEPAPHHVRALAARLGVGKPVITRALDTLSILGFVRRKRDSADRRNVLVTRTVKGSVFLTELGDTILARLQDHLQAA